MNRSNAEVLGSYASAGLVGTIIHFAILYAILDMIGPVPASTLGAIGGCLTNYCLAQQFVFPGEHIVRQTFPRFVSVAALGVMLNAVVMKALLSHLPIYICQATATATVFLFTFAINRGWTFSERQTRPG